MPEQLTVSTQAEIVGGPKISVTHNLQVTAYDKIVVTIAGVDKPDPDLPVTNVANDAVPSIPVEVQPASSADLVAFLSITSNMYGPDLVCSVDGGVSDIVLDNSQVFVGPGGIGLLGASPQLLNFRNGMGAGEDATITVFVGRNATS